MRGWLFYYDSLRVCREISFGYQPYGIDSTAQQRRSYRRRSTWNYINPQCAYENVLKCVRDHHIEIGMKQIVAKKESGSVSSWKAERVYAGKAAASSAISMKNCALCVQKRVYQHCKFSRSTFSSFVSIKIFTFFFLFSGRNAFKKQQQLQVHQRQKAVTFFYFHFTRPGPSEESASGMLEWGTQARYFVGVVYGSFRELTLELRNWNFIFDCINKRSFSRTPFESFSNNRRPRHPLTYPVHRWWHT